MFGHKSILIWKLNMIVIFIYFFIFYSFLRKIIQHSQNMNILSSHIDDGYQYITIIINLICVIVWSIIYVRREIRIYCFLHWIITHFLLRLEKLPITSDRQKLNILLAKSVYNLYLVKNWKRLINFDTYRNFTTHRRRPAF